MQIFLLIRYKITNTSAVIARRYALSFTGLASRRGTIILFCHQLLLNATNGGTMDNGHVACRVLTRKETTFGDSREHFLYKRLQIDQIHMHLAVGEVI